MDHLSKSELQEIVTKQELELKRYKTRLTDLVNAHKSLLNEKKLLESTLKSVSEAPSDKQSDSPGPDGDEESAEYLKSQLSTLMNSLTQLSEEKSRMEATFLADKKQLRSEKQHVENRNKELEQRLERETRAHLSEMENFKSKLIVERHQREKEHNDHGVMIRELQKVVAGEREKREKAEMGVESLKRELHSAHEAMQKCEKDAAEYRSQLDVLKERLKDSKLSSSAVAIKLQQELTQLKTQHLIATREEQEKIKEAEEKSKRLAAAHEERVANLELRLADLSETVGLYDRLRQSDQQAIEKLKERLIQLEKELGEEKSDSSTDDLADKVKKLIDAANQAAEKPIDVRALFVDGKSQESHVQCQEEYDQLKNEFDRYKQQFVLHQPNSPNFRTDSKEEELKSQIKKLKERISHLSTQIDDMEAEHKNEIESHKKALRAQAQQSSDKLSKLESNYKQQLVSLEAQINKQRDRTIALMGEKDQEITELREALNNLLPRRLSIDKSSEADGVVLHYSEELARRDVELARLRKSKIQLESELRELRREMTQLMSHEQHISSLLQHQLQRFEQCQSREGANLEYLKNVVFNFLLTNDPNCKAHMLNAITAVLKFSDEEKSKITLQSWWYKPQS